MHYDAYRFVQGIREKYWLGMLSAIDAALIAEARRPAGQRPGNDAEFMRFLVAARDYLLSEGRTRPSRMPDDEFLLLKPLCEQLVQRGRFAPSRLDLFAGLDAWHVGGSPGQDHSQNDGEDQGRRA